MARRSRVRYIESLYEQAEINIQKGKKPTKFNRERRNRIILQNPVHKKTIAYLVIYQNKEVSDSEMKRIIITISALAILTVLSCLFVQQHANAVVISATVKTWDKSPSYVSGQVSLNLRNPMVSNVSFPTVFTDYSGKMPTVMVDANNIVLNGVLTSFTSREDTNKTTFLISLPITQTKNNGYITSIKAEGGFGSAFNTALTDYAARLDFSKYSGAGVFQIGPKDLIDDNLFYKIFRFR